MSSMSIAQDIDEYECINNVFDWKTKFHEENNCAGLILSNIISLVYWKANYDFHYPKYYKVSKNNKIKPISIYYCLTKEEITTGINNYNEASINTTLKELKEKGMLEFLENQIMLAKDNKQYFLFNPETCLSWLEKNSYINAKIINEVQQNHKSPGFLEKYIMLNYLSTPEDRIINGKLTQFQKQQILLLSRILCDQIEYDKLDLQNELIECLQNKNYFSECKNNFFIKLHEIIKLLLN